MVSVPRCDRKRFSKVAKFIHERNGVWVYVYVCRCVCVYMLYVLFACVNTYNEVYIEGIFLISRNNKIISDVPYQITCTVGRTTDSSTA